MEKFSIIQDGIIIDIVGQHGNETSGHVFFFFFCIDNIKCRCRRRSIGAARHWHRDGILDTHVIDKGKYIITGLDRITSRILGGGINSGQCHYYRCHTVIIRIVVVVIVVGSAAAGAGTGQTRYYPIRSGAG